MVSGLESKTFLVTGAAGFIGSNLVEYLCNSGCNVRALDDFSNGRRENIKVLKDTCQFDFIEGTICDPDTCLRACSGVDYVLHQAAWGSVPRSMKMPVVYHTINAGGTLNMMEAAAKSGVKRFVYASSSSVYGDSKKLPKTEGEEGKPLSPYALTKRINEYYGRLYHDLYKLQTIGLRYFNVFGRRQDPHSAYAAAIPLFVKHLSKGQAPTIFGDGGQSRDFTYIDNVIQANLKACAAPARACGQVYNIAYGQSTTINELYQYISSLLNVKIEPVYAKPREGDIPHSMANIGKAREILGYDPQYSVFKGLELTIDWYVKYFQKEHNN